MNNKYEIRGEVTAIMLFSPKYGKFETLIDTDDLEKANSFPNTWYVKYDSKLDGYYVQGAMPRKEGKKMIRFHRLIMDFPDGVVDHLNHDTLDNRKSCNLRIATASENGQNYLGANRNSTTGIRGVSWHKRREMWVAQVRVGGKAIYLGYFQDIHEAEAVAIETRAKYMPFSQEALGL